VTRDDGQRAGRRRRVLIVISHYLPGYLVGGPVRSVEGLVAHLGGELEIFIVTSDRDTGDTEPYAGIQTGQWVSRGQAQVMYIPAPELTLRRIRGVLSEVRPAVMHLNSLFSLRYTILPLLAVRRNEPLTVVIAPRGSLDPGALSFKGLKKRLFLFLLRLSRLAKSVRWQATSLDEQREVTEHFGHGEIVLAPNFAPLAAPGNRVIGKEPRVLRMIFLSRIVEKKNLLFAVERLANVEGSIDLTVAGPVEDEHYWQRCLVALSALPHVRVYAIGAVEPDRVPQVLAEHHVLILPTLGENFGHVILEALGAGVAVLVSDRTPWDGLEALGAGRVIDLASRREWERAVQEMCDLDQERFRSISLAARRAPSILLDEEATLEANRALFN
jgi:glycosyltransferase involved in cell wall biosynthesis